MRSPFDSPTEQISTPGADFTKEIPRTDEELGLDLDVPTRAEVQGGGPAQGPGGGAAPGFGAAAQGVGGAQDVGGAQGIGGVQDGGAAQGIGSDATTDPALDTEGISPSYAFASIPPAPTAPGDTGRLRRRDDRRGTLDLGLLLLRLVVGGTFIYHGLQKLTGWFHGPGLEGTRDMLENGGWSQADIGAAFLIVSELGGGILIVLGLATPLAAGAVLATIISAWFWKQGMVPGFQYKAGDSAVELESILAGAAAAIILTGPGRLSLDRNRGWATRPFLGSLAALVAAVAAAIGTWLWLHGGNPLTGVGPFN